MRSSMTTDAKEEYAHQEVRAYRMICYNSIKSRAHGARKGMECGEASVRMNHTPLAHPKRLAAADRRQV